MRVLYYMEKELANFDPSRPGPGPPNGRVERAMSEVTSLHEDDWRSRPSRGPALTPIRDEEWGRHSPRSPRRWEQEPPTERPGGGWGGRRPRAHSMDALDDLTRPGSAESGRRSPPSSGRRGRAYAPPRSRSRDDLYDPDDSRDFPHSRDPHYDDFRSRDRPQVDPRSRQHRSRDSRDEGSRSGDPHYDGRLLEEALLSSNPGSFPGPLATTVPPPGPPAFHLGPRSIQRRAAGGCGRLWRRPRAPPRPGPARARLPSETDSARAPRGLPSPRARQAPGSRRRRRRRRARAAQVKEEKKGEKIESGGGCSSDPPPNGSRPGGGRANRRSRGEAAAIQSGPC